MIETKESSDAIEDALYFKKRLDIVQEKLKNKNRKLKNLKDFVERLRDCEESREYYLRKPERIGEYL